VSGKRRGRGSTRYADLTQVELDDAGLTLDTGLEFDAGLALDAGVTLDGGLTLDAHCVWCGPLMGGSMNLLPLEPPTGRGPAAARNSIKKRATKRT
jgi:hypothetical protein